MIEAEEPFIEGVEDITKRVEDVICYVSEHLLANHQEDIDAMSTSLYSDADSAEKQCDWLNKRPFPVITYSEAMDILLKHENQLNSPVRRSKPLAKGHELFLVSHIGSPVFVTDWPSETKPFYVRRCKHDESLVEAIDLLMPKVGELAGGSVREDDIEVLRRNIPADLDWYLDLRKFGNTTTGGFGIGFDRYLQIILGVNNIKECIPFPRWPGRCDL